MSKELEALHSFDHWIQVEFADQFKIIETALKDYEKQKNYYAKLFESVLNDKEHKSLEIIKEENVNTFLARQCKNYIEYNKALANQGVVGARHFNLTKEEFDLLKEVLK